MVKHLVLSAILITLPASSLAWAAETSMEVLPSALCFKPGTPIEVVEHYARNSGVGSLGNSLAPRSSTKFQFLDNARWSSTATDGRGLQQGNPMTLTWSIVPDGTSIFGYNGEPTSNSNLRAFLNGIYGSEAVWLPIFQQVFDRWGELTGITYIYEPNDDGSAWTQPSIASGQLGVRGDVRISGHPLTVINPGVLAYNFFPDFGDMVIDTSDGFYSNTSGNSLGLRNVLAHEHGHGLGLSHVCPINQTKLMEPFVSSAFDGPQHDDILATNRGYGDTDESNDALGTSTDLGAMLTNLTLSNRSIDDNSDIDFYSFTAEASQKVGITLTPVGSTYLSGPQLINGACSSGSNFDSLSIHDLSFRLIDTNGSTELTSVDQTSTGQAEMLVDFILPSNAGTYYIEISGDATNAGQLYELDLVVEPGAQIFADGFESGNTTQWD